MHSGGKISGLSAVSKQTRAKARYFRLKLLRSRSFDAPFCRERLFRLGGLSYMKERLRNVPMMAKNGLAM